MEIFSAQLAGALNPILLGLVGFFLLRLVKMLDELHRDSQKRAVEGELAKAEAKSMREDLGTLKRDQVTIWRKLDELRGDYERHNAKDRAKSNHETSN
jgi:hypothetical protein